MARSGAMTIGQPASAVTDHSAGPRRERKKQQTRDALVREGLGLFRAKGYEHTAVHEITDAVDVAERTFFRYFASKEDLALSFVREGMTVFAAELRRRPPAEEPLQALRNALRGTLEHFTAGQAPAGSLYFPMMELIDSTPALLAAQLRYVHTDGQVIRVLAERENVDPDTDLRPRVLAAVFAALTAMATRAWRTSGGGGTGPLAEAVDQYAGQLGPAIAGHWTAQPAQDPR